MKMQIQLTRNSHTLHLEIDFIGLPSVLRTQGMGGCDAVFLHIFGKRCM